jgi:hypothetical protein
VHGFFVLLNVAGLSIERQNIAVYHLYLQKPSYDALIQFLPACLAAYNASSAREKMSICESIS